MSSKKTIKRERDDLAERLSHLLCDLTDGRMSKTNYDVRTMVREVEATFEQYADEARADAWDEGYKAGGEDEADWHGPVSNPTAQPNPYRAEDPS